MRGLTTLLAALVSFQSFSLASDDFGGCPFNAKQRIEDFDSGMESVIGESDHILQRLGSFREEIAKVAVDVPEKLVAHYETFNAEEFLMCKKKECLNIQGEDLLDKLLEYHHEQAISEDARWHHGQVDQSDSGDLEEEETPNAILFSSFTISSKKLGKGGFKTVYKGTYSGDDVAIGVISHASNVALKPEDIAMFMDEMRIQEEVREVKINGRRTCRRFVGRIRGYYEKKKSASVVALYLLMDLATGDLSSTTYTDKHQGLSAAIQLAGGLLCLQNAQYVHKDIKPLNTLVGPAGELWTHDFGLAAKITDSVALKRTWGTRYYMPTETAFVSKYKYDMYSMGVSFSDLGLSGLVLDHSFVNRMKGPHAHRPSAMALLQALADVALEDLDAEIAKAAKELLKLEADYKTAKGKVDASTETVRLLRGQIGKLPKEDGFFAFFGCCGGRDITLDKHNNQINKKILCEEGKQEKLIEKMEVAKASLNQLKTNIDDLKEKRGEMYDRLTLQRTPDALLEKLSKGKALV